MTPSSIGRCPGTVAVDRVATRVAVRKSALRQVEARRRRRGSKPVSTARSTVAPSGMRPTEGTLTVSLRAVLRRDAEPADREVALRHRVDLAVGAVQRGHDQRAAAQRLGLADGRDGDVEPLAGLGEGGQVGGDHHRGGVLQRRVDARRKLQAEAATRRFMRLRQIFEIVVARAGEADDDAVAGQLVRADALERAEIAHPLGWAAPAQRGEGERCRRGRAGRCGCMASRLRTGLRMLKKCGSQPCAAGALHLAVAGIVDPGVGDARSRGCGCPVDVGQADDAGELDPLVAPVELQQLFAADQASCRWAALRRW